MNKQVNIDKLNEHLFESIEMLKNNNDANASDNEKMDVETAKAIADLAKVAIDGYKVKVQALSLVSKTQNPKATTKFMLDSGVVSELPEHVG